MASEFLKKSIQYRNTAKHISTGRQTTQITH